MSHPENPFSSSRVRPGAESYLFPDMLPLWPEVREIRSRQRVMGWVHKLQSGTRLGCVVGPHGSGKSTLLASCQRWLAGEMPCLAIELNQQPLAVALKAIGQLDANAHTTVVLLDGRERLNWYRRWTLDRSLRRSGCVAIVAAHRPHRGWKTVYRLTLPPETQAAIVRRLLNDEESAAELLGSNVWRDSLDRHGENFRERLFEAYEWFEDRKIN